VTRNQFLKLNEKRFGNLLTRLRRNIHIPEKVDTKYEKHLNEILDDYASDYEKMMKDQVKGISEIETSKLVRGGEKYLLAAASVGLGAAVIKAGNPVDGLPAKVAEEWLSHTLPSGLSLSDSIWNLKYEKDILSIVSNPNGLNPEMLSKQLDGFLLPGREVTTLTPYGRSLNFDSMRLARTEVVNAGREASRQSMVDTPWVTGLMWDGSGGCAEECLPLDGNIYSGEDALPDPHPQCNCPVIEQVMTSEEWGSALEDYKNGIDDSGIGQWLAE